MKRRIVALVTTALGVALVAWPASAMAPDAHGWWWFAQPAGSPVTVPPPPYVPEDGLYVASNPLGAEAVSALRFALADASEAGTLTLTVADEVQGTPVLGLCVVTEPGWEPAQGGALAEAPPYDCAAGAAVGALAEDGTSVTFPTAALVRDGALDVAVVPGTDPSGGNPTFQIAFEPPGEETLAPATSSATGSSAGPTVAPAAPGTTSSPSTAPAPGPPPFTAVPPPAPEVPDGQADAPTGGIAPVDSRRPGVGGSAPAGDGSGDTNATRLLGFAVLAGTAIIYHRLSSTPDRAPRALVRFGRLPEEAEQPVATTGAAT